MTRESHLTTSGHTEVSQLLVEWRQGDPKALDRLMPIVYDELRRLARRHRRRERLDHTLQTTALVHEAYLKLVNQEHANWQNRAQFFAIAAQLMRRILVDYARNHRAAKRGGDYIKLSLDNAAPLFDEKSTDLLALDEALDRLAELDPQQSRVVELRVFGGLNVEQSAAALGISPRTVKREWSMARAWLHQQLKV